MKILSLTLFYFPKCFNAYDDTQVRDMDPIKLENWMKKLHDKLDVDKDEKVSFNEAKDWIAVLGISHDSYYMTHI